MVRALPSSGLTILGLWDPGLLLDFCSRGSLLLFLPLLFPLLVLFLSNKYNLKKIKATIDCTGVAVYNAFSNQFDSDTNTVR